jgi:hypothetical protein
MDLLTTYSHNSELQATTAPLQNTQITTVPSKPFSACCVFTSHLLATASNSENSLASRIHVIPG